MIRPATYFTLFLLVIGLVLMPQNAAANPRVGQPLREALIELNEQGVGLMFSSELVESWMRVDELPTSNDPLVIARQILASHDLVLAEGPGGRWLVTRAPKETTESIAPDKAVAIPLKPEELGIDELTVVASRYVMFSGDANSHFNHDEIDRLPHMADDTARAIARVPAATSNDFSAHFNVRGGWHDEATMRLDSLDLVDPFHIKDLQGAFSIVDSNLIERVEMAPGGFSAKYGNGASGVVNISTLTPQEKPVYTIGVSFTNLFANGRGSFNDNAGSWMLSIRRGYMDLIFNKMESGDGRFAPRYHDILGKVDYSIGYRHIVSAEFLAARDDFSYLDESDAIRVDGDSDSLYLWTRLESQWTDRLTSEFVLWRTTIDRTRDNSEDDPFQLTATLLDMRDIQDLGLRTDWRWRVNDQWQFEFGAELRDYEANYDYSLVSRTNSDLYPGHLPINRRSIVQLQGARVGIYTAARRYFGRLTAELGWRWDAERYTGSDENLSSPRLALNYELSERTRLTASWGKYSQFQHPGSLQVEDGIENLFPATRTEHRMVGLRHQLDKKTSFRAEVYQKVYRDLRPRFTNLFNPFKPIPEAEPDRVAVVATSAQAYGLEMTLNRKSEVFSWRGSYVLSDVTDRVDGNDVPRDWNQRHAVDVILNWKGARWNFNVASRWHSGWPRTDATAGTVDTPSGPAIGVVPGDRNAGRNSNYFRVDTRISRDVDLKRGDFTYYFEIYNLFDNQNTCCVDDFDMAPGPQLVTHYGNWLPRFPSFGFSWTFE